MFASMTSVGEDEGRDVGGDRGDMLGAVGLGDGDPSGEYVGMICGCCVTQGYSSAVVGASARGSPGSNGELVGDAQGEVDGGWDKVKVGAALGQQEMK